MKLFGSSVYGSTRVTYSMSRDDAEDIYEDGDYGKCDQCGKQFTADDEVITITTLGAPDEDGCPDVVDEERICDNCNDYNESYAEMQKIRKESYRW